MNAGPWWWEYHPDTKQPIALAAKEGDVLLATGDERHSWLVASEEHMRILEAAPDLLAACEAAIESGEVSDALWDIFGKAVDRAKGE